MIDTGPRGAAKKIIAGTEAASFSPQDIRLIFITHGHLDHYGAAGEIKAWCGAPVATYQYERIRAFKPRMVYVGHGEPFPGSKLEHIYPARYQLRWWVR